MTTVFVPGQGEVDFPDSMSDEQISGVIKKQFPLLKASSDEIPTKENLARDTKAPQQDRGFLEKAVGAGEAGLSLASGFVAGPAGGVAGAVKGLTGGKLGTQEGVQEASETAKGVQESLTYQPRTEAGKEALGAVGEAFEASKLGGLGPTEAIGLAGTPAKPYTPAVGRAAGRVGGKLADIVTPTPSPEIAALAKRAEQLGIELRPDMLSNNRVARMIGEALEQVPLSGSKSEQRQIAFNKAITKVIGGDPKADRLTPDVFDKAMNDAGEKIGQISKETPINVTQELRSSFIGYAREASKFETSDVAKIVRNYVTEINNLTSKEGVIDGEAFRKLNTKINRQVRSSNNGDLKNALYGLQDKMHDALERNISSPEKLAELQDARYKYAIGSTIEPLVAKAKGGDISPAGLMGRVTSDATKKRMMARGKGGEIGDIARIGQAFLKEPPSSGTGERLGAYSLLTGGAIVEPHTAAGIVGAANIYNRLGPAIAKRAIKRRSEVEGRAMGGPVEAGKPYLVGEAGPEMIIPSTSGTVIPNSSTPMLLAGDPMGMAEKNAYKTAVGASIDASEQTVPFTISRGGKEVVPVPPNTPGLAKLLLQTGRAKNLEDALIQARQMNAGR